MSPKVSTSFNPETYFLFLSLIHFLNAVFGGVVTLIDHGSVLNFISLSYVGQKSDKLKKQVNILFYKIRRLN